MWQEWKAFTRQHKCENFKCKSENSQMNISKFGKQIYQHIKRLWQSIKTSKFGLTMHYSEQLLLNFQINAFPATILRAELH